MREDKAICERNGPWASQNWFWILIPALVQDSIYILNYIVKKLARAWISKWKSAPMPYFSTPNHVWLVLVFTLRLFAHFRRLLDRFAPFFLQGIDIGTPFAGYEPNNHENCSETRRKRIFWVVVVYWRSRKGKTSRSRSISKLFAPFQRQKFEVLIQQKCEMQKAREKRSFQWSYSPF